MSDTVLVSTRKGLFTIERAGGSWRITAADFLGDNVSLALADPRDGRRYAALDHGHFGVKMHRSTDAGGWEEIATPAYPAKPEGYEELDMWGRPLPWSTVRVWALETGGVDEPGTIWCGTIPGGLFRSRDNGTSWQMMRSLWNHPLRRKWMGGGADLPGLHSIIVDPRDSRRVFVAVSTGGIWFTADGGESWAQRGEGMRADHVPPELTHAPIAQDVHCLVQCPSAPERFWVQHHNGIFVSSDEARSFREIREAGPSVFGFPVRVHPKEPGSCRRSRTRSAFRSAGSSASRGLETADAPSRRCHAACPRNTPTTSSIGMHWRSTIPAIDWRSAPPPAVCGSARIRATAGPSSVTRCRQSMRCGLHEGGRRSRPEFTWTESLVAPPSRAIEHRAL
jgi:hypothetical protein